MKGGWVARARPPTPNPQRKLMPGEAFIRRETESLNARHRKFPWLGVGGGAHPFPPTFHGSLGFRLHKLFLFDKASTISCSRGRLGGEGRAPHPLPP